MRNKVSFEELVLQNIQHINLHYVIITTITKILRKSDLRMYFYDILQFLNQKNLFERILNYSIAQTMDVEEEAKKHGYEVLEYIGRGKYGKVYKVLSKKYNCLFVIKQVLSKDANCSEIETMMRLDNPYIMKIFDYWKSESVVYMVINYCESGSIQDLLDKSGPIQKGQFRTWARQAIEALQCCHMAGIAHNDLKPANLLIDEYNRLQLADFGMSESHVNNEETTGFRGTPLTTAPEVFTGNSYNVFHADIWSLGMTFFVMVTGHYPFKCNSLGELQSTLQSGRLDYPSSMDEELKMFIQSMLNTDPLKRTSLRCLLALPLFTAQRTFVKTSHSILLTRHLSSFNVVNKAIKRNGTVSIPVYPNKSITSHQINSQLPPLHG